APACANAQAALRQIIVKLPQEDPRWKEATRTIAEAFLRLSAPGRRCILTLAGEWVRRDAPPSPAGLSFSVSLISAASEVSDSEARAGALDIAVALQAMQSEGEALTACRTLACSCLGDPDAKI